MLEYVGKARAAKMLGMHRVTFEMRVLRGIAPKPDAKSNGSDVWLVGTIRSYAEAKKRKA